MAERIVLRELTAARNFRHTRGGVPEGVDGDSRMYDIIAQALSHHGTEYRHILTFSERASDGVVTHAFLTEDPTFDRRDAMARGLELGAEYGRRALFRKVVRESLGKRGFEVEILGS